MYLLPAALYCQILKVIVRIADEDRKRDRLGCAQAKTKWDGMTCCTDLNNAVPCGTLLEAVFSKEDETLHDQRLRLRHGIRQTQ